MTSRRQFISLLGGAVVSPQVALAQTSRRRLVAWFGAPQGDEHFRTVGQLLAGLREFGHVEGRDFAVAYRSIGGQWDQLPQLATELVRLNPDVIVAPATIHAVAAKMATTTIPIVVPVLAESYARKLVTA